MKKTYSNGTSKSPFPKKHRASNRQGSSNNQTVTKRPNIKGQK